MKGKKKPVEKEKGSLPKPFYYKGLFCSKKKIMVGKIWLEDSTENLINIRKFSLKGKRSLYNWLILEAVFWSFRNYVNVLEMSIWKPRLDQLI